MYNFPPLLPHDDRPPFTLPFHYIDRSAPKQDWMTIFYCIAPFLLQFPPFCENRYNLSRKVDASCVIQPQISRSPPKIKNDEKRIEEDRKRAGRRKFFVCLLVFICMFYFSESLFSDPFAPPSSAGSVCKVFSSDPSTSEPEFFTGSSE